MQAGNLVSSEVQVFTSRVLVNDIERPFISWSIDRELSGDMPDQVVAASGITQATGSVVWAAEKDITDTAANPWNASKGWLPRIGDRVQIFAGDTVTEWIQFTGRIDRTTGSLSSGATSSLIDDYDKLSASVSHLPLLRIMPPTTDGGAYRGVGLSSIHYVDHALRTAGFNSTPPTEYDSALAVSCQGSMWPNSGTAGFLRDGASSDGSGSHHSNNAAPWGWSVGNFNNTYGPRVARSGITPVQATVMVAPDHADTFQLRVNYGSAFLRIYVYSTRNVQVYFGANSIASLAMTNATIFTVLIKAGVLTIKNNKGATSSGAVAMTADAMTSVVASGGPGVRVAGIQVSHPITLSQEFISLSWTPSAMLDLSNNLHTGIIDAGPAIEPTPAADLLAEISNATLTAMWIDERGVLQWVPTVALRARVTSQTLTTRNDIFELQWEDSLLGSRSKVTVNGKIPVISKSTYRSKELYRGSGQELSSKEESEDIVGPGSDEDWILPDESMEVLGTGNWLPYNGGTQTFGGVFYTSSGETITDTGLSTAVTMTTIGMNRYKIKHVAGTFPANVTANLGTSPTYEGLWPRNRDKALPVIKGFGKVQWTDVAVSPVSAGGPGPELVHDCGPWNNRTDDNEILDRVASYLAGQTANPLPVITGLDVAYDPRRQLGDVVIVESEKLMGVSLRALVVGVSNSNSGSFEQSLAVRLISAATSYPTWADFEAANTGINYQQLETLWSAQTYADFEADPLKEGI